MKSSQSTRSLQHLDRFITKLAKPLSEFVILAILQEHPDIHTYELQQILLEHFHRDDDPISSALKALEDILDKTITDSSSQSSESLISQFPIPHLRKPLRELLTSKDDNPKIRDLLVKLREDLEVSNLLNTGTGRIWETISGIYQTMKELEKYNLIIVSRQEIVNGRTRKLYQITDKGREEAIQMLFTFISLNQFVIPQNFGFSTELSKFYTYHNQSYKELVRLIGMNDMEHDQILSSENPFIENQPMIVNQFQLLLQQILFTESVEDIHELHDNMAVSEKSTGKVLKSKLQKYRDKLDSFIELIE